MQKLKFKRNDGGRAKAGIPGTSGDCVIRAIAIAEKMKYKDAQKIVSDFIQSNYSDRMISSMSEGARSGLYGVYNTSSLLERLGWKYIHTPGKRFRAYMGIPRGRVIVQVASHVCAVINGKLNDTWDSQKTGIRPLNGYWIKG